MTFSSLTACWKHPSPLQALAITAPPAGASELEIAPPAGASPEPSEGGATGRSFGRGRVSWEESLEESRETKEGVLSRRGREVRRL